MQTQSPKKVQFRGDDEKNITVRIVACAGGGNETVAIDEKGGLWGCGQNESAQLGLGQGGIVPAFQNISIVERNHRCDSLTHQPASYCVICRLNSAHISVLKKTCVIELLCAFDCVWMLVSL